MDEPRDADVASAMDKGAAQPVERSMARDLHLLCADETADPPKLRQALAQAASALETLTGREAVFQALHRTATEIIEMHVVDAVYRAAVDRAKTLLDSDLAYLALYDEQSRGTRVTVAVGSVTIDFTTLHVPIGVGMGGKVSQVRTPFVTEDYLADDRLVHLPRVDQVLRAEGVRGMVGMPLLARQEFLGALFVADRRVREYSPEQVSWLQALAALIAVAVENARLFEREEASLRRLQTAHESLTARLSAAEREAAVHRRLDAILDLDGKPADLVAMLREETRAEAEFIVPQGVAAGAGAPDERTYVARMGPDRALVFRARTADPITGTDRRILERVVQTAETLLLREEIRLGERGWLGSGLMQRLLAGRVTHREGPQVRTDFGVDLLHPCTMLAIRGPDVVPERMARVAAKAFAGQDAIVGQFDDHTLVLMGGSGPVELSAVQTELNRLADRPVAIGMAPCNNPLADTAKSARSAVSSAELMVAMGRIGCSNAGVNVSAEALLLRNAAPEDIELFVRSTLGSLIDYDGGVPGDLVATLHAYFDMGLNSSRAAEILGIHPKTMVQRLDRIARITGSDLKNPSHRFRLQIALFLLSMRG